MNQDECKEHFMEVFEIEEQTPTNGFFADLINAGLSQIDWVEIAQASNESCMVRVPAWKALS